MDRKTDFYGFWVLPVGDSTSCIVLNTQNEPKLDSCLRQLEWRSEGRIGALDEDAGHSLNYDRDLMCWTHFDTERVQDFTSIKEDKTYAEGSRMSLLVKSGTLNALNMSRIYDVDQLWFGDEAEACDIIWEAQLHRTSTMQDFDTCLSSVFLDKFDCLSGDVWSSSDGKFKLTRGAGKPDEAVVWRAECPEEWQCFPANVRAARCADEIMSFYTERMPVDVKYIVFKKWLRSQYENCKAIEWSYTLDSPCIVQETFSLKDL